MSDIERRLRELGERSRSDQGAAILPPHVTLRVKRRRLAAVATSVLVTVAFAFGGAVAVGAFDSPRQIGPAEGTSGVLIDYHRTGGFAGEDIRLTVHTDGFALVTVVEGDESTTTEHKLNAADLRGLEAAMKEVDWPARAADVRYGPVPPPDAVRFALRHDGHLVTGFYRIGPRELTALVGYLDTLLGELRIEREVADPAPTLALSDRTLRPGDMVELHVEAGAQYMWGASTGLDAQRGDDWERLFQWATYRERASGPIKATRHDGVRSVGYRGAATFQLRIPQLDPGTYRVTKAFIRSATGGSLEERTGIAEVRFEIIREATAKEPFSAIWPEDTRTEAEEACAAAAKEDASHEGAGEDIVSMRHDAASIVLEFGYEVLGWEDAIATDRSGQAGFADNRTVYELRRGPQGASPRRPVVIVDAVEVLDGCWSVGSVSRPPDKRRTGVSISVRGRSVEVGFDTLGATTMSFEIGHGPNTLMGEPTGRGGRITSRLTYAPDDTGHFLILFKDENGRVFSATGGPLPAGNFTAG